MSTALYGPEACARSEFTNIVEACARAAHEANRAYCIAIGDGSQLSWGVAHDYQRDSCRKGAAGVLDGNGPGPEKSHESWLEEKQRAGWVYGPEKDVDKKTHPCIVPYDELPPEQKAKDEIFVTVVLAMATALGFFRREA